MMAEFSRAAAVLERTLEFVGDGPLGARLEGEFLSVAILELVRLIGGAGIAAGADAEEVQRHR